ncbi:alpha/beta hydrolase [soil metagenome]
MFLPLSISLMMQSKPVQIPLWANGVPGFESRKNEPEQAKDWWVKNINNPSITMFAPDHPNGCAVLIAPGGGHRELVFDAEGRDAAVYLNTLGVTAFVLKYRLAREDNSPYKLEVCVPQDAFRAMRTIRNHAKEWNVDPKRVGMLGFSAGGEVVSMIAYQPGTGDPAAPDPVDRENGKPNLQILIYPGPLGLPDVVTADAPPALFVAAFDDDSPANSILGRLPKFKKAGVPAEAHIFAKGGHAFNMGQRATLQTLKSWPQRMADWLADNGWLTAGRT